MLIKCNVLDADWLLSPSVCRKWEHDVIYQLFHTADSQGHRLPVGCSTALISIRHAIKSFLRRFLQYEAFRTVCHFATPFSLFSSPFLCAILRECPGRATATTVGWTRSARLWIFNARSTYVVTCVARTGMQMSTVRPSVCCVCGLRSHWDRLSFQLLEVISGNRSLSYTWDPNSVWKFEGQLFVKCMGRT